MTFKEIGLSEPILKALDKQGYTHPTPIQQKAIPVVMEGRDLIGCAQTGTGKTAAFALPIIHYLTNQSPKAKGAFRALILTPTRELAIQIEENFKQYGQFGITGQAVVFGGVPQNPQVAQLRRKPEVLIATPGRLQDLINQGLCDISKIEVFVLDEADRMLDMGFIHDVKRVLALLPRQRQTLLFSATMPKEIVELANSILTNPVRVEVTPPATTAQTVKQSIYFVEKDDKRALLIGILQDRSIERLLVFTRTKYGADKLARAISKCGIKAEAIHGDKAQNARQKALMGFKDKKIRVLVATDIAARGIDIDDLTHMLNFEIPNIPETYVHRIGRTGRAGAEGIAISFCQEDERPYLKDIHKVIGFEIPVVEHESLSSKVPIAAKPVQNQAPADKLGSPARKNKRRPWHGRKNRGAKAPDSVQR
jgi:ATP-dependent RNA helicase RhlE